MFMIFFKRKNQLKKIKKIPFLNNNKLSNFWTNKKNEK